jgi:FAD/FMN-containing dehydrogenase
VLWREYDHDTQAFGLASPGGAISTTGIAGLTLGGGFGYLSRMYVMACDNLISADVVTAAGDLVTASEHHHPDLFWGLRGGGGNFGVVTSFEYQLHPLGPQVLAGAVVYPFTRAAEVLRFFADFVAKAPDELSVTAVTFRAEPGSPLPSEVHGRLAIVLAVCYAGDLGEGERVLRPLRAFGPPLADFIGPMPYTAWQSSSDASYPTGQLNYWKSHYVDELTDDAIETVIEQAPSISSSLSSFYFQHLGGAIERGDESTAAFGHRDGSFDFTILSVWRDPAESDAHVAWTRSFFTAMQPYGRGVYVNNLGSEGADRVRDAYKPETYARLVALKDAFDPENVFHLNQNIKPSRQQP